MLEREASPAHSRPAASIDPRQAVPNQVHILQRQVGNQATAMLFVQRQSGPLYRHRLTPADPRFAEFQGRVATLVNELAAAQSEPRDPESGQDSAQAISLLRRLHDQGRITLWTVDPLARGRAAWDRLSGEIRIYVNRAPNPRDLHSSELLHEAVHAVHASRHPTLSQSHARFVNRRLRVEYTNRNLGLFRWQVWTEYWAYRRQAEFEDGRSDRRVRRTDREIDLWARERIRDLMELMRRADPTFDPATWRPVRP